MSINKVIAIFIVILLIFTAIVVFQFNQKGGKNSKSAKVTINGISFSSIVVKTPQDLETGLSKNNSLPQDQGMLFVFDQPAFQSFWTRNMKFPIDIIFIKGNKIVSTVENAQPLTPQENSPLYTSEQPADKVLEINAGLIKKYDFINGDTVTIE